jgi:Uncharacterized conserved protein
MPQLTPENRLALLMHEASNASHGKMGFGLLRYGVAPVVAVIDRARAGHDMGEGSGIPQARGIPIVASVAEALAYGPDVLIPAIAPAGGVLPADWWPDVLEGLKAGLSLVNGLHEPLARHPEVVPLLTRARQFVWDIRQEPPGLDNGSGRARELSARRVLFVGTDMANGKMTAALELHRAAAAAGQRSAFVATGQIGIAIAGDGVPLDAVRVDFASGAVEKWVLEKGRDADVVFVEGQGSLLHPASTATLALLRGTMPTHLILVHRAGQATVRRAPWAEIPPLSEVVRLYEAVASAGGALSPAARVAGIALNTAELAEPEARQAVEAARRETGLPVTDVVRFGPEPLLAAVS